MDWPVANKAILFDRVCPRLLCACGLRDGVWLVMVGSAECGEPCEMVRETLTKAQAKAGEIMSFGYSTSWKCVRLCRGLDARLMMLLFVGSVDARAPLINDKGEETVVALEFNITAVPALLYYAYGPKAVIPSHTINPDVIGALVGRGLKYFLKYERCPCVCTAPSVLV